MHRMNATVKPSNPAALAAGNNAGAYPPYQASEAQSVAKSKRRAVHNTFTALGVAAEAAGIPGGALLAQVPDAYAFIKNLYK